LKSKLAAEAESEEELDAVLATLQTERLLSDERYASPARRRRAGSRYGNARLKQELRQKGVSDEDIATALPEAGDETERCPGHLGKKIRPSCQKRLKSVPNRCVSCNIAAFPAIRKPFAGPCAEQINDPPSRHAFGS
jgi:SOS response regulatory protein OraA/RecX